MSHSRNVILVAVLFFAAAAWGGEYVNPKTTVESQRKETTTEKKVKNSKHDLFTKLLTELRPTKDELARVKAAESDPKTFIKLLGELDRKYKGRTLKDLGVDAKLINPNAFRIIAEGATTNRYQPETFGYNVFNQILMGNEDSCDCVVPFRFSGLNVYSDISGPELNQVERGILGAAQWYTNEYTISNPGDTTGKTRIRKVGQLYITFTADLPTARRWCVILPSGRLFIRGHSKVVGHGNSTTSYDAKVNVEYFQFLTLGNQFLEMGGATIHEDGTRSESRTKSFNGDLDLSPRYFCFSGGGELELSMILEVIADANEDGLATVAIHQFGFPANSTYDYDTVVTKTR